MKYISLLFLSILIVACADDKDSTTVKSGDLKVSVYASCTVKAENQYQLDSGVSGKVLRILVDEGMPVDSGQVILTIDNTNPKLNTENAQLAYEQAQRDFSGSSSLLKNLKLQAELAFDKMKDDSINFKRQQALWDQKIGSKIELEKKELAFSNAKNQYQLLQNQYRQTESQARTALKQAENNYRMSAENSSEFDITSSINGKVYSINKEPGETVRFQEVLAIVGDDKTFYLELEIDQEDVMKIEIGQEVFIRLDAFKGQIIKGEISKVQPIVNITSQTFIAEASVTDSSLMLMPGLTGEANVLLETKKNVLSIPSAFLKNDSLVITENKKEVRVEIGMKSLDQVEILSGLEAGQKIFKPAEE